MSNKIELTKDQFRKLCMSSAIADFMNVVAAVIANGISSGEMTTAEDVFIEVVNAANQAAEYANDTIAEISPEGKINTDNIVIVGGADNE